MSQSEKSQIIKDYDALIPTMSHAEAVALIADTRKLTPRVVAVLVDELP